ncbi:MAG: hypothetical protein D8M59_12575 [Planctomycetes bacterium]|nr:hypothetical protein [Planctomycetota bacterium]NOG53647.1 hypothetical protein [Planctomycetota bacterium]
MWDSIKQTCVVCVAGLILLPLTYWAVGNLHAADGADSVPAAFAVSGLGSAFIPFVGCSVLILILTIAGGKLTHRYTGAFILGLGWLLMSNQAPSIDSLIRSAVGQDALGASLYVMLAVEAVAWGLVSLLGVWALHRWAPNQYPNEVAWADKQSLMATGVALVLGCGFCWAFLRTDLKGQTLYGTAAAITLAVMITRMTWPNACGSMLFLAPFGVAVVGYLAAIFMVGPQALEQQLDGTLWPLLRPIPLDYAAGGLLGVSVGIAMARSFAYEDRDSSLTSSRQNPTAPPAPAVKLIRKG